MSKLAIVDKANGVIRKAGFKLKKHSPEIMIVAGTIGVVASGVMACKATTKVSEIMEESKKQVETVHAALENPEFADGRYTEEDSKKDLTIIYAQTGVKLVKLYAPSVILGALSLTSIIGSHYILRKRNIALGATIGALDKSFKEYRGRVAERLGDDMEKEIRYNIKAKEFEKVEVDEKGKEKKSKEVANVMDGSDLTYSPLSRFFDESCIAFEKDPEANLTFLLQTEQYANDILPSKRFVTVNDVYDMLHIPRTKEAQKWGWIYDPNKVHQIDFGIFNGNRERNRAFVNGYEPVLLLDFNAEYIFDKI